MERMLESRTMMTISFAQSHDEIARLVKYFQTNRATFLAPNYKEAHARQRELYQRQIDATDRQTAVLSRCFSIDALVYELYGLTEEEIGNVES